MIKYFILIFIFTSFAWAKTESKKSQKEDFDSQVVEGQIYRPELSVVTGDNTGNSLGLLRLRNDFEDHIKNEKGEIIQ